MSKYACDIEIRLGPRTEPAYLRIFVSATNSDEASLIAIDEAISRIKNSHLGWLGVNDYKMINTSKITFFQLTNIIEVDA